MPTSARHDLIPDGAGCVVHVLSRCVRRAWLAGADPLTGRDHSHRREWILGRLRHLASFFAVEVCAYAVMSNHYHLVLHCRPRVAGAWSPEEVVRRWLGVRGKAAAPEDAGRLAADEGRVALWRARLGSLSWLMRMLNEWVARRANAEDGCTGRFWEGRFRCQLLEDDAALLACMAYVDLNPIRAGAAEDLAGSLYTSVRERMRGSGGVEGCGSGWLAPMAEESGAEGLVGTSTADYLWLLEWTCRMRARGGGGVGGGVGEGKGPPVLGGLGLAGEGWVRLASGFGRMFRRVAGRPPAMEARAGAMGQRWVAGMRASREVFAARAA